MKEADEDDIGRALPKFLTQLREACVKAGGSAMMPWRGIPMA
jgi:hypothetical protein